MKVDDAIGAAAGLTVGADRMVAEVAQRVALAAQDARPEAADEAALLFARLVAYRLRGRLPFGRWWDGLPEAKRQVAGAMCCGVGERLGLPAAAPAIKVARAYCVERGLCLKAVKQAAKRGAWPTRGRTAPP